MSRTTRVIKASPEKVFEKLLEAENFAYWVVGSKRVRGIDENWPAVGSAFHHSIGFGPIHIRDRTEIVAVDPPRRLEMSARMGRLGSAVVRLTLQPLGRRRTKVIMEEEPERGLLGRLDSWAVHVLGRGRNAGSLRRLARLVEQPARHEGRPRRRGSSPWSR